MMTVCPGIARRAAVRIRGAAQRERHSLHEYGPEFYVYLAALATRSARRIVPGLAAAIPIRNVVDFGCGQGAWLSVWRDAGASVCGVDGPWVDRRRLLIDPGRFIAANLSEPIDLGRSFDLVQSLEVAEHLPAATAGQFVDTLTAHGSIVLFSAAVPGQGGENHVNEQPLAYWRAMFRRRGYAAVDYLRPLILDDRAIAPWYRYNTLLYVREDALAALPEPVRRCRIADGREPDEYWPLPDRLRHALIRRLPTGLVSGLARAKAARTARRLGRAVQVDEPVRKPQTGRPGAGAVSSAASRPE